MDSAKREVWTLAAGAQMPSANSKMLLKIKQVNLLWWESFLLNTHGFVESQMMYFIFIFL